MAKSSTEEAGGEKAAELSNSETIRRIYDTVYKEKIRDEEKWRQWHASCKRRSKTVAMGGLCQCA